MKTTIRKYKRQYENENDNAKNTNDDEMQTGTPNHEWRSKYYENKSTLLTKKEEVSTNTTDIKSWVT